MFSLFGRGFTDSRIKPLIHVAKFGRAGTQKMAPAVGFEPTTNRLTADRSTTELRWITQLQKTRVAIFAHDSIEATHNRIPPEGTDVAV